MLIIWTQHSLRSSLAYEDDRSIQLDKNTKHISTDQAQVLKKKNELLLYFIIIVPCGINIYVR